VFKAYGADEVLLKPVALHTLHLALVGLLAQVAEQCSRSLICFS
jgi:hypothetical protein